MVTNNLNNFDSPSKVLAYAGLDPVVRQSGK
ncbi:transposase [uncultured Traorella sp.]